MKQWYHSNATINTRLGSEINKSKKSNTALSAQYGVSVKTIEKWKKRDLFEDKSSKPDRIKYALSDLEHLIAINLRAITWWSLDEIPVAINPNEPEKIRSAVYRTFLREGIYRVPEKEKEKRKSLKRMIPVTSILM
ncbi:hypothetical protein [Winogradskyella sp.]|uniref:hypothetical protein n=1 Tax=Winogradskyella sp. TaxID=1883156 RepID=UPI0025E68D8B|nr:hypothetical protein [Winogradskyella sp.]MBT8245473.1 hypothetical protein [Winogradskyella sp.]